MSAAGESEIETDVLVVGGGVTGCALACYLAREGVEVVLIDREDVNTGASGRNAGSLHQQLMPAILRMSPSERAGKVAALPLFVEAVATWRALAETLDEPIEIRLTGGLMVAETDAQMRILEEKAALERAKGLDVAILLRADTRALAPYLSPLVIGAELCPAEGTLNPLRAVPALARAAEKSGARVLRHAELLAIEPIDRGYLARTRRGGVACRRLVNAAGPWAARVAAMVGLDVPVAQKFIQSHVSEATAPFIEHLVYHCERVLTLKQVANGNLIIGGGWRAAIDPETGQPTVSRKSLEGNMWVARQVVPTVGHLRLLRSWTGVNIASDGLPILGEAPGHPGFFHAIPTDAGLTVGPVCARLVAEALTGRTPSFDITGFGLDRFARVAAA